MLNRPGIIITDAKPYENNYFIAFIDLDSFVEYLSSIAPIVIDNCTLSSGSDTIDHCDINSQGFTYVEENTINRYRQLVVIR